MNLRWHTDVHLNFASGRTLRHFISEINASNADAILITGDISDSWSLERHLTWLVSSLDRPVYFVLGNHDYHGSSVSKINETVRRVTKRSPDLVWLTESSVINVGHRTALVGAEGWYDSFVGDEWSIYWAGVGDWATITDLRSAFRRNEGMKVIRLLSAHFAELLKTRLLDACESGFERIIIATHVPPWIDPRRRDSDRWNRFWSSYDASASMAEAIAVVASLYPEVTFEVLSGHTHQAGTFSVAANISVTIGNPGCTAPAGNLVL